MVDYNNSNQNSSIVTGGKQIISPPPSVDPSVGRETDDVNICEKKCEYKWWRYIKDPNDPTSIILDPNTETAKQIRILDKKYTECKKKFDAGVNQLIKICEEVCEEDGQEITADDLQRSWVKCHGPCNPATSFCPGELPYCPPGPNSCVGQCVKSAIQQLWNGISSRFNYTYKFENNIHYHEYVRSIEQGIKFRTSLPRDNPNRNNSCIWNMCDKSTNKDSEFPPYQVWRTGPFTEKDLVEQQERFDREKENGPISWWEDTIFPGGWAESITLGKIVRTKYTPQPYQSFICCMSNYNEKFLMDSLTLLNQPLHWLNACILPGQYHPGQCFYPNCDILYGQWWWTVFIHDRFVDVLTYGSLIDRLKRQIEVNGFVQSLFCKDECCPIGNPYCRSGPDPNQCPGGPCIQIRDSG